jgi:hypothetical protein
MLTGILSVPPVISPYSPTVSSNDTDILQVTPGPTTTIAGHVLAVYASQPMPTLSAPSSAKKRFVGTIAPTDAIADLSGIYLSKYGVLPKVGTYIRLWLLEFDATSPFLFADQKFTVQVLSL